MPVPERFPRVEIDQHLPVLQDNIRDGLSLLARCFASDTAPLEPYEGTVWFDTTDGGVRQYYQGEWRRMTVSPKGKPTDQTFTSETVSDVSGLSVPVVANATYAIHAVVVHRSDTATRGPRFAMTVPTFSTFAVTVRSLALNSEETVNINASGEEAIFSRVQEANQDSVAEFIGVIATTAAGNIVVRAGCEVGGNTITIRRGSHLHVERTS